MVSAAMSASRFPFRTANDAHGVAHERLAFAVRQLVGARARIFAAMTVPGVVASSEGFAFFGLLTLRKCIRGVRASTPTTPKLS